MEADPEHGVKELTPYMRGFIDAVLAMHGITHPTEDQFAGALGVLDRFITQHQRQGDRPS